MADQTLGAIDLLIVELAVAPGAVTMRY